MFDQPFARAAQWLGATAITAVLCATAAQAQPAREADYALPAQDLAQSLREVALRSGVSVIAPSQLVSGKRAPPLSGHYGAQQAIELLLEGSGLRARVVGGALVVSRAAAPVQGADATVREPAGSETIVVTGTNLRGAHPTSPVITITRDQIDKTGVTSVEQLMRTVPQNTQGGVNQENVGIALPDQDVTDHGAGLNLRGLGQRATLVLVNGRRLAPSSFGSFVDVSLIPVTALQRVEILTDGASAIYGSDAVGGVVNFILRDRFNGFESSVQAGTTTAGGGTELLLSQAAGKDWTSGSGLIAYEFRAEDEIRAGDRSFTINLPSATFLLPRERKHSLLGTLQQELAPGLRGGLTASFARRTTDRTLFQSISPLPVSVAAKATAATVVAELSYELPGGWLARLDGNYALSSTTQRQTQPGGAELVNSRDVRNSILEGELRVDGPLVDLPAGAVRLALGGEVRSEDYRDGFESSTFARVVRKAQRSVRSAYGEILVPLFSQANRLPGLERLQISAAARYDHYSRTGSSFDPKVGLLWSPVRDLNLRASYSTSFRAPLLSEITGAYTAIYLPALFLYADPAQAPAGSIALFLQGSNPDVQPETSRNWTVGGDWSPHFARGLTLNFNYYSIRFSKRIGLPTPTVNVIGNPAFEPIINRNPDVSALTELIGGAQNVFDFTGPGFSNGGATPADVAVVLDDRTSNTALTSTRGFDLGMRYAFQLGANSFVVDANVTHIIRFDEQLTSTSPIIQALDRPYRPLSWRGRGGLSWSRSGWNGSLFANYASGYRDDRPTVARHIRSYTTLDATLSYSFDQNAAPWLHGTRVSVFAENLLDTAPPRLLPDPGSTTGLGYDPINASARGRFIAVQLRRSW